MNMKSTLGWVKCREHISLLIILCIIVYVTNKAHPSLIWKKKKKSMSMYSTQYLVGAPFAWITAAMWRGMESISLWHCSGVMRAQVALIVAFSSSALLGLVSLIFLLTIPHRFSMGLRSGEFTGQLRTGIPWSLNQVLVALALCAGAKSCWKMKSASP